MSARSKWKKFTTDLKKTARDEWNSLTQTYRDISQDTRDFIDAETRYSEYSDPKHVSPKRQSGKRGSSSVIITPDRQQMPLRRRYNGTRSRRGYHASRATYRAGAGNPIVHRKLGKRRRRRRRLRWGTKVRRSALGLFEGKRYVQPLAVQSNVLANAVQRIALLPGLIRNFDKDTQDNVGAPTDVSQPMGSQTIQTAKVTGLQCMIRGCKFNMLVTNEGELNPVVVRMICGWRRTYADMGGTAMGVNTLHIFRNTDDKTKMVPLNLTAAAQRGAVWRNPNAPIDKTAFHVVKDFTFHLGPKGSTTTPNEEAIHGNNTKSLSFWWEMHNKRMNFISDLLPGDSALDKENKMTWYPVVIFYHSCPENAIEPFCTYSYDFCVYYKDPRG